MALVVPALVFFAQAAPQNNPSAAPRYFTNAENVRRIAAGKRFVAFATSGGVRVFERETQKWRVYTQNDGLPTHNIHDVVFDPQKPDTLWILCGSWGDWANEQPEPDLRLATLDLASGKVESIAPPIPAPRTARMGYHYFLDYRLSVSDGWAFVFTDKGSALVWDRNAKKWSREISVEATPPRPSNYAGHSSSLQLVGSSGSTLAFFVQTKLTYRNQSRVIQGAIGEATQVINQMIPMGDGPPPHILLYNRQTGRSTRHPIGQDLMGQSSIRVVAAGRQPTIINGGRPGRLVPDTRPGAFLIESLASELTSPSPEGDYSVAYTLIRHRVAPNLKEPVMIGSEKITNQQAALIQQASRQRVPFWTDFLVDGNTLWVTGYNDPNYPQSAGIAWLDLATGKWDGPKPAENGLKANFARLSLDSSDIFAWQQFSFVRRYTTKVDDFLPITASNPRDLPSPQLFPVFSHPDPRAKPTNDEDQFAWADLSVLGTNGNQVLVLGPAEASRRYQREGNGFKFFVVKYDTYYFYDTQTKNLTPLEMKGLGALIPRAAGFSDNALFFLTEERVPGERRGAPVVVRWDSKTGAVTRYPESLFRDVSVAAQRAAGTRQQVDLKKRQTERNVRLLRDPKRQEPAIEIKAVQQFIAPLSSSFLKAAGTTWLRLDQHLFRYDAKQDTWLAEGLADSMSAEGETALWKQAGPSQWRFESPEALRLRGEVARWSAETGWQRLELGESARQAGNSVLFHDGALWLTGVGALRLPQSAWQLK